MLAARVIRITPSTSTMTALAPASLAARIARAMLSTRPDLKYKGMCVVMYDTSGYPITIVPMAILSVRNGLKMRVPQHRRIARWTFPLWMYVSVTGVIVYFFLYQWYPPA